MSGLNPRQRDAVRHIDSPLLVLAGAGSGKTRVITQKIAYLIQDCGYKPNVIAAVTFTNKAAREMKSRIGQLMGGKETRALMVSTFHTFGLNLLRRELVHAGLKSGFSIFDAHDTLSLLRELTKKNLSDNEELQQGQWQISRWKNDLLAPEDALRIATDELTHAHARLYAAYHQSLRAYNAVDFDDLILRPVQILRDPEVRERWQNRVRYLLVDEYQDTNNTQYELVKLIVGARGALTVVGDDDQSIYAWRGARPQNMERLQQDFPRLTLVKLEQNYRSTGRILKAANRLIANNPHVFEKKLWSELGPGDALRVLRCNDDVHEAERVVSEILSHKFQHRTAFRDYAILYRGNHQSRVFEKALRDLRVPYFITGGQSFFERTEVKDIMAYLRLLANPADDTAFLRIVNTPRREIGPTTLEKLGIYASSRQVGLIDAADELGLEQHLGESALARLRRFTRQMDELRERGKRGDPVAVVRDLIKEINYESWMVDNSKDDKAAAKRMENVWELVTWTQELYERDPRQTLGDIVAHMCLMDILDRQNADNQADQVSLMTLHGAKGLEFPHVYIAGMEEELLPHRSSIEADDIEEERRLAYVGITRAQKTLTFSHTLRRRRYGENIECVPSRFLEELPAEDLQWEARAEPNPEQSQQRGQAHLANLRGMLGKA
ncbi:MAG: DNA helicase Rep [Pseudomonadota bacterium]